MEELRLAFLRYMCLANESYKQQIHRYPAVREVENTLYRELMDRARCLKQRDVN